MQNRSAIYWRRVNGALVLVGLVWVAAAIGAPPAQAQTYSFSVAYSFKGGTADGEGPEGVLFMDKSGNLYGTTVQGPGCSPEPCTAASGIAFKVGTTGTDTVLHKFKGSPDGASPYGGLISDGKGSFYGMTSGGGTSNSGVLFKVNKSGESVLHTFTGPPGDGAFPYGALTLDSSGNLYGTTSGGGTSNSGVVFEFDTATGEETILYNFCSQSGCADGAFPYGGLVRSPAGILYGTTSAGGITTGNCFPSGCGVVFNVPSANKETVLYTFTGGATDGAFPYAGLIADSTGNFYGTTYNGGPGPCANGCGVVFKLVPATKQETLLYSFAGYPNDGAMPYAGLTGRSTD